MTQPSISLVVAAAENGVIGRGGGLPWRIPSDLRTFRRITLGKPVIMGRKTFQSIGHPLDGRSNIVVSRQPGFAPAGVEVARTIDAAIRRGREIAAATGVDEVMVIGGAEVYRLALPLVSRIYLTRVHAAPEGDAVFTELPGAAWREVGREPIPKGPNDQHDCTLIVLERV